MPSPIVRSRRELLSIIRAISEVLAEVAEELLAGRSQSDLRLRTLRRTFEREFKRLDRANQRIIEKLLPAVYFQAAATAEKLVEPAPQVAAVGQPAPPAPRIRLGGVPAAIAAASIPTRDRIAIARIQLETRENLERVRRQLTRAVDSIVFGSGSQEERIARVKEFFDARTSTAYVRVANRTYSSDYYARMVVEGRSAMANREATRNTYLNEGVSLAMVSQNGSSHPGCARYEGRVFSLTGTFVEVDGVTYEPIETATGGGKLFHPHCRHVLLPFTP